MWVMSTIYERNKPEVTILFNVMELSTFHKIHSFSVFVAYLAGKVPSSFMMCNRKSNMLLGKLLGKI